MPSSAWSGSVSPINGTRMSLSCRNIFKKHIQKTYSKNIFKKHIQKTQQLNCKILFDVIININEWQSSINNKLKLIRTEVWSMEASTDVTDSSRRSGEGASSFTSYIYSFIVKMHTIFTKSKLVKNKWKIYVLRIIQAKNFKESFLENNKVFSWEKRCLENNVFSSYLRLFSSSYYFIRPSFNTFQRLERVAVPKGSVASKGRKHAPRDASCDRHLDKNEMNAQRGFLIGPTNLQQIGRDCNNSQ